MLIQSPTPRQLRQTSESIAVAGARSLRPYQVWGAGSVMGKADGTIVTDGDRQSEAAMGLEAESVLPDVPFTLEESAQALNEEPQGRISQYRGFGDPTDGTTALAAGIPASTVGAGYYDLLEQRLVAAAIAFPATGVVASASQNEPTRAIRYDTETWTQLGDLAMLQVWPGELDAKSLILFDHARGFSRKDPFTGEVRQVLTDEQAWAALGSLARTGSIKGFASNLAHQMAVAMGGERVAASVTTAVGGPWDLLGALLVLNAGGVAQGYQVRRDRSGQTEMTSVNPLDIMRVDVLITANNERTLSVIESQVLEAILVAA